MNRKSITIAIASGALLLAVAIPRWHVIGAGGMNLSEPDVATQQRTEANSFGSALGAPFRAIGKLFGGGKKKKPVSKISDKDIKKFESSQVNKVSDARTAPSVTTSADDSAADHLRKGRELLNAGQLNEAIAELTLATSLDPKSGEAHTLLGVAYDRKGYGARAQEAFETALHAPDDEALHLNNLGYLHFRHGEFDEAIKYLKRAAKLNPDDSRIWSNLTMAQLAADKFNDAYKSSVHVIGEFDSRLKIAARLEWRGLPKEAIKHLEKARALQPESAEVLSRLVVLYEGAGRAADADAARASLSTLRTVAAAPKQPDK